VQQSNWQSKDSRPSGVLSCWPDGLELTPGFYPSGIQRAAQTVLGVYLKRTSSRVTRASSALVVLTDMRYANPRTHSLQGHGTDRRTDGQIAALRNAYVMGGSRPCKTRRKIVDVDLNLQKNMNRGTVYSSSLYTDIAVRSLTCLTATGTHMPYGITQCYLPPGRSDIPVFTPAEAGTRLSDPGWMQG